MPTYPATSPSTYPATSPSTYKPKRRSRVKEHRDFNARADCDESMGAYCPRHNPADYAAAMARHATDSLFPIPGDR